MKRLLSLFLVFVMLFATVASFTACKKDGEQGEEQSGENAEKVTYTVSVETKGGMIMSGLAVYVYADNTLANLEQYGETNSEGKVTFNLPKKSDYAVVVSGAPKGYDVKESYSFDGNTANIKLTSSLIKDESLSSATLGLGDVMYDFSVVTPAGETVTLSEMLEEKKMVLLNFFFTTCGPCASEFPYMEEAYQMYKDDVGIIALDPLDDNSTVGTYQASMGLTFPMAACQPAWSTVFNISGYPTSVVVDRYGVICLIEVGGLTSLRPFTSMFEHFTAEDYEQKICTDGVSSLISQIKPTYTMDTSENIGAAINNGSINVTYRPETDEDSAEFCWPFIIGEKDGKKCVYASNQKIDDSYAIIYADVELKAGQAVGFDYYSSTERLADIMYVIVNDEDIYQISGNDEVAGWKSCYPCVAEEDGTYEVALCYLKDEGDEEGDDTVYVTNMRVVDSAAIDTATYLPREAATSSDGFEFNYVNVVLNENDGYYHVGDANGPLLLANLMGYSQFNEEETIFDLVYDGEIKYEGKSVYDYIVDYCSYASNSSLNGYCTVTANLAKYLQVIAEKAGFDADDKNEWLRMCRYYQVYGTNGVQLEDPIKGLAPFSAYKAQLGVGVASNVFTYERAIIPRGLFAEFIPTTSGVYRITSHTDYVEGVDAWIFDENKTELLTYAHDERMYMDDKNCSMVYYMEAGKKYYINIAFWDIYNTGTIPYDIEFIGGTFDLFRLCSPGFFTYDSDATGEQMYHVISGGIKPVLHPDGYYYEDLGKDANGNQLYGSKIYADFSGLTPIFDAPIATVPASDGSGNVLGIIDKQAFDFSKTESDLQVINYLKLNNNDVDATIKYLKDLWGDQFDGYMEIYMFDDVVAGKYHGTGNDLTEEMRSYLAKMDTSGTERNGCVAVDKRLAELLSMVMDKYTFENVDHSWLKLCYYYDHLGPQ